MSVAAPIMLAGSAVMSMASASAQADAMRTQGAYSAMGHAMSADQAARQGMEAMMDAAATAEMRQYEATQLRKQAEDKAAMIRSIAVRVRSQQQARSAASGVVVGEGSAQALRDESSRLAERDALVAMYTGNEQALLKEYEAENIRKSGSNKFNQAFMNGVESRIAGSAAQESANASATATLLGGVAKAADYGYQAYQAW